MFPHKDLTKRTVGLLGPGLREAQKTKEVAEDEKEEEIVITPSQLY